ncbi:MAG: S8 family peptidase, partial [Phaeodactylibacter sp.]|nr:S8 family peptidase [Phaeodactylibacter sp.]
HGHGTNVSGIVAAMGNNGAGYAGVDWNSQAMICKILDDQNFGFYSWWTEAIYYAVDNGASVINMSVGGSGFSTSMEQAVNYAHANDVVIVACMMNTNEGAPFYPSAYANTIAVGATDTDDSRVVPFFWSNTSGSNYGPHIDLVAPGNYIYGLDEASNSNYNIYWGGTSQASPLVAGVVALMKGLDSGLDVETIRSILRNTADDQVGNPAEDSPGWDRYYGAGRLNAFNALDFLVNMVGESHVQAPWGKVKVYPNPASPNETAWLEVQMEQPQEVQLTIRNSLGQQLHSSPVQLEQHALMPLPAALPTGLHWLSLQTEDGAVVSLRWLVE